jgi:pyruvate dehydrogenase E2 component (dihydrolipoamide acetyltransferase)
MAETISMPKLGFDMREGVLVRWIKNEGETINKGDVLAEIETDKATVEVESSASGVVRKLLASQGDSVPVGAVIAVVGTADEVIDEMGAEGGKEDVKAAVDGGPKTVSAPAASSVSSSPTPATDSTNAVPAGSPSTTGGQPSIVKASPLAKKIAHDRSVNLSSVVGTGPGGRIVRRDVEAALVKSTVDDRPQTVASPPSTAYRPMSLADETIQTTKLRQAIGRRLVESKTTIPHFYVSHEFKMEALLDLRKQVNTYLPDGEKISVNDFVVKAAALALREFPNLNASLAGDKVIRHGAVNVGVAVTVPGGLMTVVVKDTDQKPLRIISGEVKAMAARAREGKVKPEDVDGSTFSTSNLGMYDVEDFIAIINPPEAAILAIGSAREVPVVEDGQVKPGWRMKATISVDHRISDGAEAAQFMQALAKYLEVPVRLLL